MSKLYVIALFLFIFPALGSHSSKLLEAVVGLVSNKQMNIYRKCHTVEC